LIRSREYLDWLRTQRCVITGRLGNDYETIDPAHIGTAGTGIKSPDNEALPILHRIHAEMHSFGEMSVFRRELPDDVLRSALRAYAKEMYERWQKNSLP
jgi:hypothetical protein